MTIAFWPGVTSVSLSLSLCENVDVIVSFLFFVCFASSRHVSCILNCNKTKYMYIRYTFCVRQYFYNKNFIICANQSQRSAHKKNALVWLEYQRFSFSFVCLSTVACFALQSHILSLSLAFRPVSSVARPRWASRCIFVLANLKFLSNESTFFLYNSHFMHLCILHI